MKLNDRSKSILTGALVVFVIALLLALAEGATRLRQWMKYGHFGHLETVYAVDAGKGLRVPVANAQTATIRINSLGFRGPEIETPKPPGRIRIAFLGASTTFCAEVSGNDMTWPHLVTQHLQSALGTAEIDYVNGAVPGYSVRSSLRNLRERIARLEPDVIVIYHATNDLSTETRTLAQEQGLFQKEGQRSWIAQHSLLWDLVGKNLRIVALQRDTKTKHDRLQFAPAGIGDDFRTRLTELVSEAAKIAKVVALVTFSHQIRAQQTPEQRLQAAASALYYMPFMTPEGLLAAFARYNQIIGEVTQASDALLIAGEMDIPGDSTHFNDTVHFKDEGSRAMARRVSEALLNAPQFQALAAERRSE